MTLTMKTDEERGPPPRQRLRDDYSSSSSRSSRFRTGTHQLTPSSFFYCPQGLLLPPRREWCCRVDQCHSNPACPKPWSHSSAGGNSLFRKLRLLLNLLLLLVLPTRQRQQQQQHPIIVPARWRRQGRARRQRSSRNSNNGSDGIIRRSEHHIDIISRPSFPYIFRYTRLFFCFHQS
jgi:hypothetical protein